ncbi:BON domain-containing protein [Rhizobium sp. CC-YZS058]|uniref:BON domain-containing protein n=1 Tax=Rhizobium sp. CC-YZS058 TaxID=3042153 RepID=UPI002B05EC18|nr:BON domain-containing protein [Rhizobium sp. CC-YZS058]MEA3533917.1 BON domain-containing protein [Rhizobium sp. CC-YZS058]
MFMGLFTAAARTPNLAAAAASVTSALLYESDLDDAEIVVSQSGSALVLDGTIRSDDLRRRAVDLARSLVGCEVRDQIVLTS